MERAVTVLSQPADSTMTGRVDSYTPHSASQISRADLGWIKNAGRK